MSALLVTLLFAGCLGRRTAGNGSVAADTVVMSDSLRVALNLPKEGPFVENDTTFLYKLTWDQEDSKGHIRAFVVRDRLSESYRRLYAETSPDSLDEWHANAIHCRLERMRKEQPEPFRHYDLQDCPTTWIPLQTLRGKHYVDMLTSYPLWLTDSLCIRQNMDGPHAARIEEFERCSKHHYRLKTSYSGTEQQQIDIHIIDPVRKIAVIVFRNDVEYALLCGARERIDQFDLVEWAFTEYPSGAEIPWDEVDYKSLISASDGVSAPATGPRPHTWIGKDGSRKRWGPFVENDTTFLFVEEYPLGSDTNHYKVFIRKAPQTMTNLNFARLSPQNKAEWKDFTYLLREIKKSHPEPLPHHAALKELPHSWTPVRSFGGNYYVDGFHPYPVWISDSLFVRQFMDGPCPSRIDAAERISPTHYRLRTSAGYSDVDRVDIHIVDNVRTIAVFTFSNDEKTERFHSLYAPFETGLKMDMVDFYSLELPEDEVEWDEIDFEALISGTSPLPETDLKKNKTNKK